MSLENKPKYAPIDKAKCIAMTKLFGFYRFYDYLIVMAYVTYWNKVNHFRMTYVQLVKD